MSKKIDMVGKKIGDWTIVSQAHSTKNGTIHWNCICKCGHRGIVAGTDLRKGESSSCRKCGHKRAANKIRIYSTKEAKERKLYTTFKASSKYRDKNNSLKLEDFLKLISKECEYCGEKPLNVSQQGLVYQGIDRVDNKKGYEIDNVVPCCKICNNAKHTMTKEEWDSWRLRLAKKTLNIK